MLSEPLARRALWLFSLALFGLLALSLVSRHLHVDEVGAIYSMRLIQRFGRPEFAAPAELYMLLLAPLAGLLHSTYALWLGLRSVYAVLLLAFCLGFAKAQAALPSPLGRASAFAAVVTFAPLFRHGIEVRHDAFVALGFLGLFALATRAAQSAPNLGWFLAAGAMVALLQASSFKSISFLGPSLLLAVWLAGGAGPARGRSILRAALASALGLALGTALAVVAMQLAGTLGKYLLDQQFPFLAVTHPSYRLRQLPLLLEVVNEAPVHAGLAVLGVYGALARRSGSARSARVALGFAAIALFSARLNPTLFPYNFHWLALPVLLLCCEGIRVGWETAARWGPRRQQLLGFAAIAMAIGSAARGFFDPYRSKSFRGQLRVVTAAESLTSATEPVLDLTGLVANRPPVGRDWMVHSLFMRDYHAGRRERVRELVQRDAPPVAVTGQYRFDFLDSTDRISIARHYLPISSELQALGAWLPERGAIALLRSGNYLALADAGEDGAPAHIDARNVVIGERLWLDRGPHTVEQKWQNARLVWVGPAKRLPAPDVTDPPLFEPPDLPGQL